MLSDQSRIIEQATFSYSPLSYAFQKQIHWKQKEILEDLANRRMEERVDLSNQIDFNNLIYHYNSNTARNIFCRF